MPCLLSIYQCCSFFIIILESSFPLTCTWIEDAYEAKFAYAFDSVNIQCQGSKRLLLCIEGMHAAF